MTGAEMPLARKNELSHRGRRCARCSRNCARRRSDRDESRGCRVAGRTVFTVLPPLSLYVHLPWCVKKCPYCDFNSHEARGEIPEDAYVDALLRDLELRLAATCGAARS